MALLAHCLRTVNALGFLMQRVQSLGDARCDERVHGISFPRSCKKDRKNHEWRHYEGWTNCYRIRTMPILSYPHKENEWIEPDDIDRPVVTFSICRCRATPAYVASPIS